MPVYNGEKHLREAIKSVLNQTFADFEFIIINDGSIDNTENIIQEYSQKDKRIRCVKNITNLGLVPTLNKGLNMATGKYIARMDADDICHQGRFQKQIDFMENNPAIMICGTSYKSFGVKNKIHILPNNHEAIKVGLLFGSCICHPSVILRKNFVADSNFRYIENTWPAEDYKAWCDSVKICKMYNLPDILLCYREHETQISTENSQWQTDQTNLIRLEILNWLHAEFNDREKQYHINNFIPGVITEKKDLKAFDKWKQKLLEANKINNNFSTIHLKQKLNEHIKGVILNWINQYYFHGNEYNVSRLWKFWMSGLIFRITSKQTLKICLKSLKRTIYL